MPMPSATQKPLAPQPARRRGVEPANLRRREGGQSKAFPCKGTGRIRGGRSMVPRGGLMRQRCPDSGEAPRWQHGFSF